MSLLLRRPLLVQASSEDPINQYVTSGLVIWLDGIKNTRNGRNTSSTKWEDLSGNGYDCTYYSSKTLGDNYCIPNGGMAIAKSLTISDSYTMEIVLKSIPNSDSTQMIAAQGSSARHTMWISKPGNVVFGAGSNNAYNIPYGDLVSEVNTCVSTGYLNGSAYTFTVGGGSWSSAAKTRLFAYTSNTNYKTISRIYALRVYNRALSANEILQNYNADKIRFNSGI